MSKECKGIIFRGYSSEFWTGERFGIHQGFRLLKRKSCTGCEECGGLDEYLQNEDPENIDHDPIIKHNALYSLVWISDGFTGGFVEPSYEEFHIAFEEIKK